MEPPVEADGERGQEYHGVQGERDLGGSFPRLRVRVPTGRLATPLRAMATESRVTAEPAVHRAAALAPLALGMLPELQPRGLLLPGLGPELGVAVSGEEPRDLWMTASFMTRAVARAIEDPMLRLVLSGVERQLVEGRAPASCHEAGLRVWGEAVGVVDGVGHERGTGPQPLDQWTAMTRYSLGGVDRA